MSDLDGTTILLTGGTGSFGLAFVEYLQQTAPNAVVRIYSRDEAKQEQARSHLGLRNVRYLIGDVRDHDRLQRAVAGCDVVVHAAAMKNVPACEYNPFEAVHTNVIGTQHVVETAIDAGVARVIALSTDKAVNPVNVYGATKLCAEKIVVQGNSYAAGSKTRLAAARYGNVLGSRGSVVHAFRDQARTEGRLMITDSRMTRFCMTQRQAVEVVLKCLACMQGGEVFIPKIPSMRITELAEVLCPGVPTQVTGIRPGEKLHEILLTADEARHAVDTGDMFVVLPETVTWSDSGPSVRGVPVDDRFAYASDTNDQWLDTEGLGALLANVNPGPPR
jgi:UDP-N-acetylglucosamine 4,6-dehydratase/5-epimerase